MMREVKVVKKKFVEGKKLCRKVSILAAAEFINAAR